MESFLISDGNTALRKVRGRRRRARCTLFPLREGASFPLSLSLFFSRNREMIHGWLSRTETTLFGCPRKFILARAGARGEKVCWNDEDKQ